MGLASLPARSNQTPPLCLDDIANNYRLCFYGGGGRGGGSSEFHCRVSRRLFLLYERSAPEAGFPVGGGSSSWGMAFGVGLGMQGVLQLAKRWYAHVPWVLYPEYCVAACIHAALPFSRERAERAQPAFHSARFACSTPSTSSFAILWLLSARITSNQSRLCVHYFVLSPESQCTAKEANCKRLYSAGLVESWE